MDLDSSHGRAATLAFDGPVHMHAGAADLPALETLARVGFIQRADEAPQLWRWRGDATADRHLLNLLTTFDLRLQLGKAADETAWIAVALWQPAGGRSDGALAGEVFAGSGFRPEDAVRSCLGEFAEFQSWLHRPSDSARRCARGALGDRALDPWSVLGFGPEQHAGRDAFNDAWLGYDAIPDAAAFDGESDWSAVESLIDGSTRWLPTQLCYGRYAATWRNDSSGCAAGPSADDALAAAIHELIERDATGVWWYARCPRPALDPATLGHDGLRAAIAFRAAQGQRVSLLDLTHDLGVPVAAAILLDAADRLKALGFACKAEPGQAAASAYLEMCQMELSIELAQQRVARADGAASADDRRLLAWLSSADPRRLPQLAPDPQARPAHVPGEQATADIIARLATAGLPTYRLNLQRANIDIPAQRVFAPGLCHFKPRLGHARLVQVPKRLGWCGAGFSAADLATMPLPI